jgi:hypothetical protein
VIPERYRAERDPEGHGNDRQRELGFARVGLTRHRHLAWVLAWVRARIRGRVGRRLLRSHPGVYPGIDFPADLVDERIDDGGLILRTKLAVRLGSSADLIWG